MTDVDYNPQLEEWFSPVRVAKEFVKLGNIYSDAVEYNPLFKRAREMMSGVITLFGAYALSSENVYYMQSNNQTETPDVMAAQQQERVGDTIMLEMTKLELVEMEKHANTDDIVEFLKQTKLAPTKSYTENDLIALMLNRNMSFSHREVYERLKQLNPKPTIYAIGKPTGDAGGFIITQLNPRLTKPIPFNLAEVAKKYQLPERVNLKLGIDQKITHKTTNLKPISMYEVLGLDKAKIDKKFGVK